jgi:hypothetical protein
MEKLKDKWYNIRIEEGKKARTGVGGAVCVDDEFESAMRFAEAYLQSKIDAVTDEEINKLFPVARGTENYKLRRHGAKCLLKKLKQ